MSDRRNRGEVSTEGAKDMILHTELTVSRKNGVTLIELLVVIGLVGLLAMMILPAIQSSRESARRSQCVNHLKQIGLGVANFESVNQKLPSLCMSDDRAQYVDGYDALLSIHYRILPYIEERPLFDSINIHAAAIKKISSDDCFENRTVRNTRVDKFLCPSDQQVGYPGNNYRGNLGPYPHRFSHAETPGAGGPFEFMRDAPSTRITDGLSTTVGFSERLQGGGDDSRFDRSRDFWYAGFQPAHEATATPEQFLEYCGLAPARPLHTNMRFGKFWLPGIRPYTVYDHVFPPNPKIPDCSSDVLFLNPDSFNHAAVSARSNHPGGVHAGFMDGSVRFVKNSVSLSVWRAAATRAGKDDAEGL